MNRLQPQICRSLWPAGCPTEDKEASQMINKILVLGMMVQAISSARDRVTPENPDSVQPEVLVRVFGAGGVSGTKMSQSQVVAKQILASAGVRVRWAVSALPRHPELQT